MHLVGAAAAHNQTGLALHQVTAPPTPCFSARVLVTQLLSPPSLSSRPSTTSDANKLQSSRPQIANFLHPSTNARVYFFQTTPYYPPQDFDSRPLIIVVATSQLSSFIPTSLCRDSTYRRLQASGHSTNLPDSTSYERY